MSNPSQSNRLTTAVVIIFIASVCIVSAADAGTIYMWSDANGVAQFSDTCPAGVECRVRRLGAWSDPLDPLQVAQAIGDKGDIVWAQDQAVRARCVGPPSAGH